MNIRLSVENALVHGATLLPIIFNGREVQDLQEVETDIEVVAQRVPRFGELVKTVVRELRASQEPMVWLSSAEPEVDDGGLAMAHADKEAREGMTILVPLSGPRTDFHFADFEFMLPYDLPNVQQLRYGVGTALLLRQHVVVQNQDTSIELPQIFHLGLSRAPRSIRVCDILLKDGATIDASL